MIGFFARTYVEVERQTRELVQIQQLQTELREEVEQTSSAPTYSQRGWNKRKRNACLLEDILEGDRNSQFWVNAINPKPSLGVTTKVDGDMAFNLTGRIFWTKFKDQLQPPVACRHKPMKASGKYWVLEGREREREGKRERERKEKGTISTHPHLTLSVGFVGELRPCPALELMVNEEQRTSLSIASEILFFCRCSVTLMYLYC